MLRTVHQTRTALGTTITLLLVADLSEAAIEEIFRKLWLQVFWYEKRFSRFLPDSELSRFNRAAGTRQYVSEEFRDMMLAAKDMAELSGGLFTPFILPALQRAGYKHSFLKGHENDYSDDHSDRSLASIDALHIGDDWAEIPYGTTVHIGGCGKGYVGDLLATSVKDYPEVTGYWFSIGGDIVAYGSDCYGTPWTIQIESAKRGRKYASSVAMTPEESRSGTVVAVATSTIQKRSGVHNGKKWHHIIDPRTEQPSQTDVVMSSVKAGTLIEADVMASNIIITGSKDAPEFIAGHNRSVEGVLLQCKNASGRWRDVQIGSGFMGEARSLGMDMSDPGAVL